MQELFKYEISFYSKFFSWNFIFLKRQVYVLLFNFLILQQNRMTCQKQILIFSSKISQQKKFFPKFCSKLRNTCTETQISKKVLLSRVSWRSAHVLQINALSCLSNLTETEAEKLFLIREIMTPKHELRELLKKTWSKNIFQLSSWLSAQFNLSRVAWKSKINQTWVFDFIRSDLKVVSLKKVVTSKSIRIVEIPNEWFCDFKS